MQEEKKRNVNLYVDPLCCWSYALYLNWKKVIEHYPNFFCLSLTMGGMIRSWNSFFDPLRSVNNPHKMGPVWLEASQITGITFYDRLWVENPPTSSFPSCLAVKCALLQSPEAAEHFLCCLWKAVMEQGMNISEMEILLQLADQSGETSPEIINAKKLKEDMKAQKGMMLFKNDLSKIHLQDITRFPTLTLNRPGENGIMLVGYRPAEVLEEVVLKELENSVVNTNL